MAVVTSRRAIAASYVVSVFLVAMDIHIVNVALPTLSSNFHVSIDVLQWAVTGYVLGIAMFIPASGWIADRFGTKRTFILAMVLFTAASALCGLAQSISELIAFRFVQGAASGVLMPVSTTILFREYPAAERARISRVLFIPIVVAPAVAPALAGLLIDDLSWRWVFFINVPIGISGLIIGGKYLVEHRESPKAPFDLTGFLLAGLGLSLLLFSISEASSVGFGSPTVLLTGIFGLAILWAFVKVNRRTPDPILRLSILRDRLFRATNIVMSLNMAAYMGLLYLVPQFLQNLGGRSALQSGLTTCVEALGIVAGSNTLGRLYSRIGPRRISAACGFVVAVTIAWFAFTSASGDLWLFRLMMFVSGYFEGAALMCVQASMFTNITSADTAHGSAISNTQRQAAVALGIALLTAVLNVHQGSLRSYHVAFVVAAALAVAGAVVSATLIRDADAYASMVPAKPDDALELEASALL